MLEKHINILMDHDLFEEKNGSSLDYQYFIDWNTTTYNKYFIKTKVYSITVYCFLQYENTKTQFKCVECFLTRVRVNVL